MRLWSKAQTSPDSASGAAHFSESGSSSLHAFLQRISSFSLRMLLGHVALILKLHTTSVCVQSELLHTIVRSWVCVSVWLRVRPPTRVPEKRIKKIKKKETLYGLIIRDNGF